MPPSQFRAPRNFFLAALMKSILIWETLHALVDAKELHHGFLYVVPWNYLGGAIRTKNRYS
jgi:hypothetical protein